MSAWYHRSALIARVTVVRQLRKARDKPWLGFLQGFAVLFGVVLVVGRLPVPGYSAFMGQAGAYVLGRRLAAGESAAVLETVRGFAGVMFVLMVFLTLLKEATEGAMESHVEGVLVATDARTVAVGGIAASLLFSGLQTGVLVLAGAAAFAAGSGSLAAGGTFLVAGTALLVTAITLGFAVSIALRLAFQEVPFLRRNRILVGGPMAVAYFALFVRARESMALLGGSPVGWYADAALAPVVGADPLRVGVVLAGAPLVAVAATAATVPLASRLWYGDGAEEDRTEASDTGDRALGKRAARAVASRPTAAVANTVWLRVRREPRSLMFAAFPVAVAGAALIDVVAQHPRLAPGVVAVYASAAVGMGATLNPLGNAGACLPATLTAPQGGIHLVRGYVLSAALPGLPAVVVATLAAGAYAGVGPAVLVGTAALGGALAVASVAISLGVGVAIPNLEGLRPTGSGLRPPKLWATSAFLLVVGIVGGPVIAAVGFTDEIADAAGVSSLAGFVLAGAAGLVLAGTTGWIAYRRAHEALATYAME